jgi:hypothetical protein
MDMKRAGLVSIMLFCAAAWTWAVDVNGEISTEARVGFEDALFLFNEENAGLAFEQQVDDALFCRVKLHARYINQPVGSGSMGSLLTSSELGFLYSVFPVEISVEEAYFSYGNFIMEGLDLSVGKQRITWGAADVLNPTDLLNPLDLSDPMDFGRKMPSIALNLTYTPPMLDGFIQLVYEPYSQVALLNPSIIGTLSRRLYSEVAARFIDATSAWESETVQAPEYDPASFAFGAKVGASIAGFDMSANYVTRINDMPFVTGVDLYATLGLPPLTLNSRSYSLGYYREHEAGFDVVKDLGFVLAWAEVGVFFPEEKLTRIRTFVTGTETLLDEISAVAVSGEPYVKYTAGVSQRIGGIFYFNLQYNHGFFTERGNTGPERLQDYALLRLELSLLSDTIVFGATGIGNVNTLYDAFTAGDPAGFFADNYGVMGGLDFQYNPSLNLAVKLGVMFFEGTDTATLGLWRDNDLFSAAFEVKF